MEKLKSNAEKATQSIAGTIEFTKAIARKWRKPPFQRDLTINKKVEVALKEIVESNGVIPGVLSFGHIIGDDNPIPFLFDGQHRREMFFMSDLEVGYASTQTYFFNNIAEMAKKFVQLNGSLVRFVPDDLLRGMETEQPLLKTIRKRCLFVGYRVDRRRETGSVVAMANVLRSWSSSCSDVPSASGGAGVTNIAARLTAEDVEQLSGFLHCAYDAWGGEPDRQRLWKTFNLSLCMWLYRRLVLATDVTTTTKLSAAMFTKCLMSLSADAHYVDWLLGRNSSQRFRSPAYTRIKTAFQRRLKQETGVLHRLPAPTWAAN